MNEFLPHPASGTKTLCFTTGPAGQKFMLQHLCWGRVALLIQFVQLRSVCFSSPVRQLRSLCPRPPLTLPRPHTRLLKPLSVPTGLSLAPWWAIGDCWPSFRPSLGLPKPPLGLLLAAKPFDLSKNCMIFAPPAAVAKFNRISTNPFETHPNSGLKRNNF